MNIKWNYLYSSIQLVRWIRYFITSAVAFRQNKLCFEQKLQTQLMLRYSLNSQFTVPKKEVNFEHKQYLQKKTLI